MFRNDRSNKSQKNNGHRNNVIRKILSIAVEFWGPYEHYAVN